MMVAVSATLIGVALPAAQLGCEIRYQLDQPGQVSLAIYDSKGHLLRE